MLSFIRTFAVSRALAFVLIAMCSFVAVERAQASINDIQHELSIVHDDRPAELASAMLDGRGDDPGHDHDRARASEAGSDDGVVGDKGAPASHHHHAEGPQAAYAVAPSFERLTLSRSDADFSFADIGSPRSAAFGLERPPKA